MKKLTFAFDVENGDSIIEAGTVVEIYDTWRQYEGFTPVRIGNTYEYFTNGSFVELRNNQ